MAAIHRPIRGLIVVVIIPAIVTTAITIMPVMPAQGVRIVCGGQCADDECGDED